jgi:hypothetical protein
MKVRKLLLAGCAALLFSCASTGKIQEESPVSNYRVPVHNYLDLGPYKYHADEDQDGRISFEEYLDYHKRIFREEFIPDFEKKTEKNKREYGVEATASAFLQIKDLIYGYENTRISEMGIKERFQKADLNSDGYLDGLDDSDGSGTITNLDWQKSNNASYRDWEDWESYSRELQ